MKTSILYAAKSKLSDAGNYVFRSAKKMVLGDYAPNEQETLLSLGGSVVASIVNVDAPLDVRDFAYDITHWGEGDYFAAGLALDAVGFYHPDKILLSFPVEVNLNYCYNNLIQ